MFAARDETPKVNGSEGAFIAIIIVLAVIVVAACTGIFLLLRYWEPTEQERSRRRRFSIRRAGAGTAHPLPIGMRDAGAPVGSLSEKLGNMFRGRRLGSGWQVAPDDDDWASGDEEMAVHRHERTSVGHAPSALRRTIVEPDAVFAPPGHASPLESTTPAAAAYENPFEPPPNPFLNSNAARHPHIIGDSGTHFKEEI